MNIDTTHPHPNTIWTPQSDPIVRESADELATLQRRLINVNSRLAGQTETTNIARARHASAKAAYDAAFAKWRADGYGESDLDVLKVKMDDAASVLSLEETKRAALEADSSAIDNQLSKLNSEYQRLLYRVREERLKALEHEWLNEFIVNTNQVARQMHMEGVAPTKRERRFDFLYQAIGHGNFSFQQACKALDLDDWPKPPTTDDDSDGETV